MKVMLLITLFTVSFSVFAVEDTWIDAARCSGLYELADDKDSEIATLVASETILKDLAKEKKVKLTDDVIDILIQYQKGYGAGFFEGKSLKDKSALPSIEAIRIGCSYFSGK
ncbi:hypothetical protein NQT72_15730 [Pseudoalteromonas carrageenovora]|uniref:hypothetical protein n=1 Tax=Pseudoalteromonas carrageenovora TaxID=227 RepID=UPI00211832E3|nr:hypothetical protein [Pseudoalteromonas carrageenovora]MCQ8890944.1 hypothetical protein [Pseudoalteromonas carrageenovora]